MPDKQNENKFMAMLERKGIVRKAGAEDEPVDSETAARPQAEADLRSLLGAPDGEKMNVTPSARQPIPGLSNPVFPSDEQKQEDLKAHLAPVDRSRAMQPEMQGEPLGKEYDAPDEAGYTQPMQTETEAPEPTQPQEPADAQLPVRSYSNIMAVDPFKDEYVRQPEPTPEQAGQAQQYQQAQEYPQAQQAPQAQQYQQAPQTRQVAEYVQEKPTLDSYTDRYLDVEELYEVLSLKLKRTDTVYLIEEYLKTLPDSLPDQSRRDIVEKIVTASGFDYDLLMGDGVMRVKMLKEYAERFALYTEEYINARNAELSALEQQILTIRRLIENRRDLHKKQFFAIEAEAQRLKEILTFISG